MRYVSLPVLLQLRAQALNKKKLHGAGRGKSLGEFPPKEPWRVPALPGESTKKTKQRTAGAQCSQWRATPVSFAKLSRARSRLYRKRFSRSKTHWKALEKIYIIHFIRQISYLLSCDIFQKFAHNILHMFNFLTNSKSNFTNI